MSVKDEHKDSDAVRVSTGAPWNVELVAERVGTDVLCCVGGGAEHVGAVSVARWDGRRVRMAGEVVLGEHKEGPLAAVVAHQLCKAAHATVVCVCGIHFDGISAEQIRSIEGEVHELAARAAGELDDTRVHRALEAPGSVLTEIRARAAEVYPRVRALLDRDVAELCERAGGAEREGQRPREVGLFAPLYLSNACPNDCSYCGFRRSASFERRHLRLDEAVREAQILAGSGFTAIDLVTGEIPTDHFVDSVCEVITVILRDTGISHINLNMGALTPGQYTRLRDAGASNYHLYQETYDPEVYREVHRHGQKRDMPHRLASAYDVVDAGFDSIGLAVLLGLREPAYDLACLCAHASMLLERRADLGIGFSLPRIQSVDESCEYSPGFVVNDELFIKCMLVLKELYPESSLTLTSRESAAVREVLLPLGVTKISAGVSTAPGGYGAAGEGVKAQFSISDDRSLEEVAGMIRGLGLEPVV